MAIRNGNTVSFTTDRAQHTVRDRFADMVFDTMSTFAQSMTTNVTGYGDHRPTMFTSYLLNLILDKDTKQRIKLEYRRDVKNVNDSINDAYERDKALFLLNMDYFGKCLEVFDKWFGIVNKQAIGGISPEEPDEQEI